MRMFAYVRVRMKRVRHFMMEGHGHVHALEVGLQLKGGGGMTVLKWHLRCWELSWLDPFLLEWPLTTPNSLNQLSEHSSMHSGAPPLP